MVWQETWMARHPAKFAPENEIFRCIHRGDRIFIGTGCGEPQYLVQALIDYMQAHPLAFFDAEVLNVVTLGVAPYTDPKFKRNVRHNAFYVGGATRGAVNEGRADYTPISLSEVSRLLRDGSLPIDVALVQTSPPDAHGLLSLGVSVDIVKEAVDRARTVIAQVNSEMPRVHGDTFVPIERIDYLVPHDEALLEFGHEPTDEISERIGRHVARIIKDGDTLQVGYGKIPNAIMANLREHRHLGIHTELLSDGIVDLMRCGAVDNSRKTLDRGKTVATFCMGSRKTYRFLDDNPAIAFRTAATTNDPLVIARQRGMTAINSALAIDLTGQTTAESIGGEFYSGIGGQGDFMRGAALAPGGKAILALPSTAADGRVSRIVAQLPAGVGVTLIRTDVRYVVTEYGIAYLQGKSVRERALDLIAIAHPDFRAGLIEEAKRSKLIYADQAFVPGKAGEYPEHLEARRTTKSGLELSLRPVKISDEALLRDFFHALSDESLHRRFLSIRTDMPHERLQEFCAVDFERHMVLLALPAREGPEEIVAIGQYCVEENRHTAEVALVVRDDYQNLGVGSELLARLTQIAMRRGLLGFSARVLLDNRAMVHLFERRGFHLEKRMVAGTVHYRIHFRDPA
ncbi:MAG: GNAT family N-acetyltransferase [Candidatus Eisenbacteria bacterium]|uniref:GNAT family N-acetyltransferase n=1 Tax=Eiseniibacteriota bacterium TaxID=2212470 RepID=A0A938BN56_UNCEI|nr:GNAT family N-acetyltransferase [Candidatus Eisenbacteria bacterium]